MTHHSRISVVSAVAALLLFLIAASSFLAFAQQSTTANAVVPTLVNFSGVLTGSNGKPLTNITGVTFSLYAEQEGGAPLWLETQNVQPDKNGNYSVMLGSSASQGLPASLFASGQARWLGIQPQGQAQQPRIMLLSVPYALKAGDAQTVGGLPPSAFVLAAPPTVNADAMSNAGPTSAAPATTSDVTTTGGTANAIPLFTTATNIQNSLLTQTAKTAINVGGKLILPATGTATSSAGKNSRPQDFVASVFNSTTSTAVAQTFQWQAEPVGNDTSTASGSLNLLFGQGTSKPAETGLNIASNGQITFATGQTFPGTGTVTSVGTGLGLTGGPITNSGTLTIDTTVVPQLNVANTFTANQTVNGTLTATSLSGNGASVTNVNASQLGGLASSAFAQLAASNTFTGNQMVNGNVSATGVVTGSSYQIGSNLFAFGSYANGNAFLGFAGSPSDTAQYDTAVGVGALPTDTGGLNTATGNEALYANTTGGNNTASGAGALLLNTTGSYNTASGLEALWANTTGAYNTASGVGALLLNTTGSSNTAMGLQALMANTTACCNTAAGYYALEENTAAGNTAFGYTALETNTTGTANTAVGSYALVSNSTGVDNTASGGVALYSNTTGVNNTANGLYALYSNTTGADNTAMGVNADRYNATSSDMTCLGYDTCGGDLKLHNATAIGARATVNVSNALVLGSVAGVNGAKATTMVGIGTTSPTNLLTLGKGFGPSIADGWTTYSSRRWKTNIQPLHNALGMVEQLRGVSYDLKDSGKHEIGVIAEEVGAVVPEVVTYEDNGKDARGVDYSRLTALLIEATKEQQVLVHKQQQEIRTQQAQIKTQQTESKLQQARINEQQNQIKSQARLSELQQAQIAQLTSQVKAIQTSLKTSGRSGAEVRTVKAQVPTVQQ